MPGPVVDPPLDCPSVIDGLEVTLNQPTGTGSDRPIEVNWGDGSALEDYHGNPAAGGLHFPAVHTYAAAGPYTITVDPLDDPDPAEAATIEVVVDSPVRPVAMPELELVMKPVED
jgi:hypothetical protein